MKASRRRRRAARASAAPTRGWLEAERLLVVRADNIGDIIMAEPALRAVRRALPGARITLLASMAGTAAAGLVPGIDEVITWRVLWQELGRLPLEPDREWALIERLRQGRYDGAIIMTSFSQTPHAAAFACWLAGIPLRAGASREQCPMLTDAMPKGPIGLHQVDRNLALVGALGFPPVASRPEVRVPRRAEERIARVLGEHGVRHGEGYLLLCPWASAPARTYPSVRAAEAGRRIAAAAGLRVVIAAHSRDARQAAAAAARIGEAAVDLSGQTSVEELAALIAGARLVMTSNTAAMHLADALGTPQVVGYSGTDRLSQWRPQHAPHVVLTRPVTCSPCYALACPYGLECLDVDPADIVEAALGLLADSERRASRSPWPASPFAASSASPRVALADRDPAEAGAGGPAVAPDPRDGRHRAPVAHEPSRNRHARAGDRAR